MTNHGRERSAPVALLGARLRLSAWIMASRPRTLSLSVTPVFVGAALAWAVQGQVAWSALLAALIASAFIQIGTNLHNDASDAKRGGDGPDRVGPPSGQKRQSRTKRQK